MSHAHDFLKGRLATGARTDPWAFVGRAEEIAYLLQLSKDLPPEGKRSQTVLLQGAPGSGKTSLMAHVARLMGRDADAATGTHLMLSPPRRWEQVDEVYGHVATMLADAPPPVGSSTTQKTSKVRVGGGALGGEHARTRTTSPVTFAGATSIADWHRSTGTAEEWHPKRRVVVFSDEVQEVQPGGPAAALVEDLHAQASIPVLLVCAGLSNSEKRLKGAGLSRIDNVLTLGALSHEEAVECAERSLRQAMEHDIGGSNADIARWAEGVARASDGWPRHLHTYLHETWSALAETAGPDLTGADLERTLAKGDKAREAYYRRRVELSSCPPGVLQALHNKLISHGAILEQDARSTVRQALRNGSEDQRADWSERFETLDEAFDKMLSAGVLSKDGDGRYHSPIPSLTTYILSPDPGMPSGTGGATFTSRARTSKAPSPN